MQLSLVVTLAAVMIHWYRLRGTAPYVWMAGGTVFASYATAIYVDSTRRKQVNFHDAIFNGKLRKRLHNAELSEDPIGWAKAHWSSRRESQKTIYSIIAANAAVFLAWRVPALSIPMRQFFLHSIRSHPLSMLGSIFSHRSFTHLLFNLLALNSFGTFLHDQMGREQFIAFYLSAGSASSLASHLYKSLRLNFTPSLGASGAIFGVVGGCAHYPQLKVSLIFLPIHSVPISQALPVMMGIDAVGLVRNWSMFDHAAHLGGSLFGYAFYPFSQDTIWKNRRKILNCVGIK